MKKIFFLLFILCIAVIDSEARTYALCSAVSNYQREGLRPLTQTTKDAKSFAAILKSKVQDVSLITGQNATESHLKTALTKIAKAAKADDQIIFFFSGHGGKNVFCLYDTNMSYYDLLSILTRSKCKNIVLMIDACESGSLAHAVDRLKKENSWYGNVASLVSSRANESSIESPIVGAGFLAQGIMKSFRGKADADTNKKLTIKELFTYVFNDVTTRAERMGGKQHPQLIAPASMQDLVIWQW